MRLGINVPNDLIERFKPLKATHNLSQICRDAIQSRVEAYEKAVAQADSDEMQVVVDRLASDYLKKTVLDWQAIGRDDAKDWVQAASLDDFEILFHNVDVHKKIGVGKMGLYLQGGYKKGAARFVDRQHEHEDWFERMYELDEDPNHYIWAEAEYTEGWFSYVTAVWQMVKNRIAADAATRDESRQKAKDKPEIPDHLVNSID
ncbi:hypothetical protein ACFLX5_03210 [Chloroflexota bacterium]